MDLAFLVAAAATPEIVVTAERRAAPADRVPGSIATLGADEIARIGPEHPAEALNRLAGVNIHRNNGLESLPAIRSPVLTGGQSAGSFLVLEDGVAIRAPALGNVNQLFETSLEFADRVEVTRGPGSALYGSNAVHGIVNVLTPTPGKVDGAARLSVDSVGRRSAQTLIPADTSYLALFAAHEDGWRAASGLDQQKVLAGWTGQAWGLRAEARAVVQNLNQETAGFVEGPKVYTDRARARSNPTPEAYRDSRLARAHVRLERDLGPATTLVVTPSARFVETDLILSFFPSRAQEITRQKGGGVQAALYWDPTQRVSVIVGADIDRTRGELSEVQTRPTVGTFVQGVHYDYQVDATMLAGFAQASLQVAPQWRAVVGLRAEQATYDYETRAPAGDSGRFRRPADRSDDFSYATPKLGLVRTFAKGGAAFVNFARGARAPQAADLYSLQTRQRPGEQKPETIDSVEAGLRLPVGRGRVELVGYAMEKRDTAFRNADGLTITNGRTRHQGVELSGLLPLSESLDLAGWGTIARHTYRFESPADGVRSGADVDTAPRRQGNATLSWRASQAVTADLEAAFSGAYFTDAANTRRYPGHTLINTRVRVQLSRNVALDLAARNLTDERYAERADFAFGSERYFPGEPRRVSLTLSARR